MYYKLLYNSLTAIKNLSSLKKNKISDLSKDNYHYIDIICQMRFNFYRIKKNIIDKSLIAIFLNSSEME